MIKNKNKKLTYFFRQAILVSILVFSFVCVAYVHGICEDRLIIYGYSESGVMNVIEFLIVFFCWFSIPVSGWSLMLSAYKDDKYQVVEFLSALVGTPIGLFSSIYMFKLFDVLAEHILNENILFTIEGAIFACVASVILCGYNYSFKNKIKKNKFYFLDK